MIGSGRRDRTCRVLVNSQTHTPSAVDRNKLVETPRIELGTTILQGSSATHSHPRFGIMRASV